ncbi:hypothetical protein K402DRAFT_379124 [Aulographum hederae CBS 113979]|uniref:HAM1-like N-terminal domain-containing protein n=1 Tax=Aulographum hederae CBS 113979 TaxID=1176131 RepID=A0A6G1GWS7_9PEZI|nr:hypothetical protein K402DRAFT_379124 [Aulographum hederae CBS 113979]
MDFLSSCCGLRKPDSDGDRAPLLPQYKEDTTLQRELKQKLHTYQMLRAFGKGYMPSNEQTIINLRTLLAQDILNPDNPDLSDSGRLLVKFTKQWLRQFIELLQHKNSEDQIQDFIWFLSKSRVSVDLDDISRRASKVKAKADTAAAYKSLQTVGSLLLTNSDFRLFLGDLSVVGREIVSSFSQSVAGVAEKTAKEVQPSQEDQKALSGPGADSGPPPSASDFNDQLTEVSKAVGDGVATVAKDTHDSLADKMASGGDAGKDTMLYRLKAAVLKLRKRPDYSDSVSTISLLIKRYAMVYSRALQETADIAKDDVEAPGTDRAFQNFYALLSSFGEKKEWDQLEEKLKQVMSHSKNDPEFEDLLTEIANSLQKLLTDPDFFDHADEKFQELRNKSKAVGTGSSLRNDVDSLLAQTQSCFNSVLHDEDVASLLKTGMQVLKILSPAGNYTNTELLSDAVNVFVPLLISAIQYIPIPRLEVSTPEIDLLLENLVIEPGRTINHTSFLPYKLRVETYNDLEIRKARFRTTSSVQSLVTIKIDGLTARADELGFWLRAHSGLLRLADEGIASFQLDERGIDIHLDVEIGKEKLEKILTLKAVRVHIHKLTYTLRKSKFSFFGWLFKPLVRPIVRKVMEKQLASAIADAFHAANRELLFARERLRATRVSDPKDVVTFFKAVAARLTPEEDPDVYTRVGIAQPGKGVFRGVYAPGSIVKLWNEEAAQAGERVDDYEIGGWRNEVFDMHTVMMGS